MTTAADHELVGRFIERVATPRFKGIEGARQAFQVSRSTVYRIYYGEARIGHDIHRRVERALDLPYESLDLVRDHDWDGLKAAGLDPTLLEWVQADAKKLKRPKRSQRRG